MQGKNIEKSAHVYIQGEVATEKERFARKIC